MVLEQAVKLSPDPRVRFAALVHDLGKGTTPDDVLPSHWGHEERGARMVEKLAQRLKLPREYRDLAVLVARYHLHCHRALELRPSTVLKLLQAADAFRRPERFAQYLVCCEADARGRTGLEARDYPQPAYLAACREAAAEARLPEAVMRELAGPEIGQRLDELRIEAIAAVAKP
jgi:tRNA nucleotidyltransferase (CCA-adding enzyme)